MTSAVRAIYVAAVVILAVAGTLLTAREDPTDAPADLPPGCTSVPDAAVAELFPGRVARTEAAGDDAVQYGRWLDPEGEVLVELRCARITPGDVEEQDRALDRARRGDGLTLLPTDPEATLDLVPDGALVRQLDRAARVSRTWFVRTSLTPAQAERLVRATLAAHGGPDAVAA